MEHKLPGHDRISDTMKQYILLNKTGKQCLIFNLYVTIIYKHNNDYNKFLNNKLHFILFNSILFRKILGN